MTAVFYRYQGDNELLPVNGGPLLTLTPPVDPDPDPDPDPAPTPASWQAAVDSRNMEQVVLWYEANTGFDGVNPADASDLPLSLGQLTSGTIVSQYDGQVFEGIDATSIRIAHNNVTVRRCRVTNGVTYGAYYNPTFGSSLHGNVIEFCTFRTTRAVETNAAMIRVGNTSDRRSMRMSNNEVIGFSEGFRLENICTTEYNYFHDFLHPQGGHSNGIRHMGVGPARAYRNFITDGTSGSLSMYFDKEATHNITYEQNILSGTITLPDRVISPQASPSYFMNMKGGAYMSGTTNIKILGNYWCPGSQYGNMSGGGMPWGTNGNERVGNRNFLTGNLESND